MSFLSQLGFQNIPSSMKDCKSSEEFSRAIKDQENRSWVLKHIDGQDRMFSLPLDREMSLRYEIFSEISKEDF